MSLVSDRLGAAMPRPSTLHLCLFLACSGDLVACGGTAPAPSPAASPQAATATPTTVTDKSVGQPTVNSAGEPAKMPTLVAAPGGDIVGGVPGPIDPSWFRSDLFPGATVTSTGRTARDEAGLFATQMLLALPDGSKLDGCLDTLSQAVAGVVPQVERLAGKDGRVTLTGSNDDYAVTLICGEAKGKLNAYISYRWLRPPTLP